MVIEVVVTSRDTIKPSSPTPDHLRHLGLSFLDQLNQKLFTSFIYFYSSSDNSTSTLLKKSLSKTLTGFYPLAGRFKDDLSIDCNDVGVDYFEAQVNCSLSQIVEHPDYAELNKLLPYPDMDDAGDMLFAVQVNTFLCGGMAISVCFARKFMDALSFFTVFNSWAAFARNDHNNIVFPKFNLAKIFPPRDLSTQKKLSLTTEEKKRTYVTKRFVFSGSAVSALKARYGSTHKHLHPPPSRAESLSAFIWSRFMVSTQGDKASEVGNKYRVVQAVNLRPRADPPLPGSYFGNLSRFAIAIPSMEGTPEDGFGLITQMRESIRNVDSDYVKKLQEGVPYPQVYGNNSKLGSDQEMGIFFTFTSMSKYSVYEADFGWGRPIWATVAAQPIGNVVLLLPTKSTDEIQALINMKKDELEKLEADKEFMLYVSSTFDAKGLIHSSL